MSSRCLVSVLALLALPVGCSSDGTKPRLGTGGVAQTGGSPAGGRSGTGGASSGAGGGLGTGGAAGSATSGRLDGGTGRDSSIAVGGATGTGGLAGGGATGQGGATGTGGRTGLDGGAGHGGATGVGGAGSGGRPDVGGAAGGAAARGGADGGGGDGGAGGATAGVADDGGGRDEWAEGEFRVCMGDEFSENTWARVYRYDAATSSCVKLMLETPGCSLHSGFLVDGPWWLCDAMVVPNVESCDDSTVPDPAPFLAESVTGSFSVSTDRLLEADVALAFASGGPPDRSVKVSGCRLPNHAGCSADDCRQ